MPRTGCPSALPWWLRDRVPLDLRDARQLGATSMSTWPGILTSSGGPGLTAEPTMRERTGHAPKLPDRLLILGGDTPFRD